MILTKKISLTVVLALWTSFHVFGAIYDPEGPCARNSFSSEEPALGANSQNQDSLGLREECSIMVSEFLEGEIVAQPKTPALIIDSIQFANIDKKGRIIDHYGEQIEGRYVKYLGQRISYRSMVADSLITLDVKFFNPRGKLMRDANSPDGCSYRVSFRTESTDENHLQYLGRLQSKFGKGYRMEIYAGPECLLSTSVPTRGMITYVPIMMRTTSSLTITDEYRKYLKMSLDRRAFVLRDLHLRKYTGPFMGNYLITGWKAVEQ